MDLKLFYIPDLWILYLDLICKMRVWASSVDFFFFFMFFEATYFPESPASEPPMCEEIKAEFSGLVPTAMKQSVRLVYAKPRRRG